MERSCGRQIEHRLVSFFTFQLNKCNFEWCAIWWDVAATGVRINSLRGWFYEQSVKYAARFTEFTCTHPILSNGFACACKQQFHSLSPFNRALYGYEAQSNCLKLISKGDGGLVELADELNSGKIMYAFVSVQDPKTSLTKFLLINWQVSSIFYRNKWVSATVRSMQTDKVLEKQ